MVELTAAAAEYIAMSTVTRTTVSKHSSTDIDKITRAAGIFVSNFQECKNKNYRCCKIRPLSTCDVEISSSVVLQEVSIFEKVHLLVNCGVKDLQSGKDYHRLMFC